MEPADDHFDDIEYTSQPRLKVGWYIGIFLIVTTGFVFLCQAFVPQDFIEMFAMALGFIITYGVHHKIETGRSGIREGATYVIGLAIIMGGSTIPCLPFYFIWAGASVGWVTALVNILITYLAFGLFVVVTATILAWTSDKSPLEVIRDSIRLTGIRRF